MFPALAPTRFIGATPLLPPDRAWPIPTTIVPAPGARPVPESVVVQRALPRSRAIDARRTD